MFQKFLIGSFLILSSIPTWATSSLQLSELSCTATNSFGVSKMQFDPKTKILKTVTNSFLKSDIHQVSIVESNSVLISGKKASVVIGYLSYKDLIGQLRTPHVTLEFNTLLNKPGSYQVTGFLFHRDFGSWPLAQVACRLKLQNQTF